jgi:hypothetical protein
MPLHRINEQVFGPLFGAELDVLACEALLHTRWPEREREQEPSLMRSKWWDYRLLHPTHATYLFAHILDTELRSIIRTYLDNAPARLTATGRVLDWHAVKEGDVFEPPINPARHAYWKRKLLGLIRARQAADADGIPYDLFCREGLRHYYLGAGSYMLGRAKVPEPNLLYSDACLLTIRTKWLEQLRMRVQHARHPAYLIAHDDHHPDRLAHRLWLVAQLRERPVGLPRQNAYRRLVQAGLLPGSEMRAAA